VKRDYSWEKDEGGREKLNLDIGGINYCFKVCPCKEGYFINLSAEGHPCWDGIMNFNNPWRAEKLVQDAVEDVFTNKMTYKMLMREGHPVKIEDLVDALREKEADYVEIDKLKDKINWSHSSDSDFMQMKEADRCLRCSCGNGCYEAYRKKESGLWNMDYHEFGEGRMEVLIGRTFEDIENFVAEHIYKIEGMIVQPLSCFGIRELKKSDERRLPEFENLMDYVVDSFPDGRGDKVYKLKYPDREGVKERSLMRLPNDKDVCVQIFDFKRDFNQESARVFLKQYDDDRRLEKRLEKEDNRLMKKKVRI